MAGVFKLDLLAIDLKIVRLGSIDFERLQLFTMKNCRLGRVHRRSTQKALAIEFEYLRCMV